MRRRLLVVLSVFSLLALAAFVVPLLDQTGRARTQAWALSRDEDLDRFVALAALAAAGDAPATTALVRGAQRHAELYGEGVLVVDARRTGIVSAGLSLDDPGVAAGLDAALRNQPSSVPGRLTPFRTSPYLWWRPVGSGLRVDGAVLVRADPSQAAADVGRVWTWILLGAFGVAVAFAALALVLTRWVLRPIERLARGVGAVARGRMGAQVAVRDGPPELRELTASFNRMSAIVQAGAREQRELVADASHQIRNPLAALRLRVDGLEHHVDDRGTAQYDSALAELDRLERLLDGMLGLASAEATVTAAATGGDRGASCDAADVAAARVEAWRPAAIAAGVALDGSGASGLSVEVPESDLEQVLDVLLDNAIRHGGAGTTVDVRWWRGDSVVQLVVVDDGPGIPAADLEHARRRFWQGAASRGAGGSGLGLAIADRLVRAHGGYIDLGSRGAAGRGLCAAVVLGAVT